MSKTIKTKDEITARQGDAIERDNRPQADFPFFSFRYSYRSISAVGNRTRVVAKERRFEDGKLESEDFEGETERDVYQDALSQTMELFERQLSAFFGPFEHFFPRLKK